MNTFRDNGAVGALLDEYEKALLEFIAIIKETEDSHLTILVDPDTTDPNCKTIQTMLAHVVRAGYGYAIEIRKAQGEVIDFYELKLHKRASTYLEELKKMFAFTEKVFKDYPNLNLEEANQAKKIRVKWGQYYDIEQLMEHAIVHKLRHRRQLELFIIKIKSADLA